MLKENDLKLKKWQERKQAIEEAVVLAGKFFTAGWKEQSVWDCLQKVNEQMEDFNPQKMDYDIDTAFENAVLDFVDYKLLGEIKKLLISQNEENKRQLDNALKQFEPNFKKISALFLCYLPEDTMSNFPEKVGDTNSFGFFRFLGQSVFGHNREVGLEAYQILERSTFSGKDIKLNDELIFMSLLFLSFDNFENLNYEQRFRLISMYVWSGIKYGVPVERILQNHLAGESNLINYINTSNLWSQAVLNNDELIFADENGRKLSVTEFINGFLKFAGNNDLQENLQKNYVEKIVSEYQPPAEKREKLLSLLALYLRLRECNLIDYNGFLSNTGLVKSPFNWQELVKNGISEVQAEEIKNYLSNLHQALRVRMEIINSLRALPGWSEEPYLSRILFLSDLYEEACGLYFGPLVYFDAQKGKWSFYIEFPAGLKQKYLEAAKEAGIDFLI